MTRISPKIFVFYFPSVGLLPLFPRDVSVEELKDFDEVLAVGTAVVVTPVGSATILGKDDEEDTVYKFGADGELGETTKRLYHKVRAIQMGDEEDTHGWNMKINND